MRRMVFAGLRAAGDERSRAFLEAVAGDRLEQQSARLAAIGELGALCSPASEPVLIDAVREGDYQIVTAALDTLEAIFPEDRTRTSLIALESALSHLSEPAASYLAWRGDTDTLVSRLAEIGDRGVREQLRLGLIRRGVAPAQPVTALLASDEAIDRIEGAWIAGAAGDRGELASAVAVAAARAPEALAAARARLAGRGDEVGRQRVADAEEAWAAALWAAARLGADARRPALAALQGTGSSRPPPSVRLAALRYLGERGDAGEVGPVLASLSDPDPEVRKAAAAAAASLAPERAPAALAAIDVPDAAAVGPLIDVAIRRDAAALMKSGSSRRLALPALIAEGGESLIEIAGGAGEDAARLAAIAALGRRGDERSESALRGILDRGGEPDAVRAEAYRSLRRLERRVARLAAMESPPEGAPL
jgi:HEAT repeat protein